MPVASCSIRRLTSARACSERLRTVASNTASSGMMLSLVPPDELADGDDHRVEHVEAAGDHGLQGDDDLAGHRDRVLGAVRLRAVPALADDAHAQLVGGGDQRARDG